EAPEENTGAEAPEENTGAEAPDENTGTEAPEENTDAEQPAETTPEDDSVVEDVVEPILNIDADELVQIINFNLEDMSFSPDELLASESDAEEEEEE
ncbi:hypothetical protein, partial [Alteribacillus iranensis]